MTTPISATFLRDTRHGGDPDQPTHIAAALTGFLSAATASVDIAIYDFRLSDELGAAVVQALTTAADRGVSVRIGYDLGKPSAATAADFAALQADPAPIGTADWVHEHFDGTAVQTEGIAAAPQLMHSKYVLRDAGTDGAAVWTGSTNFTDDAWTLQENNIILVQSPELAAAYRVDFDAMWTTAKIKGTGKNDGGSATLGSAGISWDFAPGDGKAIDAALVQLIAGAQTRIVIASMVLTSHTVLAALAAAVRVGKQVSGIYDAGQMDPVVATWRGIPADAQVVADFSTVSAKLSGKQSTPYTPTSLHDFMHNKVLVCDDTVVTGSYNFSANAERNAENQLRITDPELAGQYCDYIQVIAAQYAHHRHHRSS